MSARLHHRWSMLKAVGDMLFVGMVVAVSAGPIKDSVQDWENLLDGIPLEFVENVKFTKGKDGRATDADLGNLGRKLVEYYQDADRVSAIRIASAGEDFNGGKQGRGLKNNIGQVLEEYTDLKGKQATALLVHQLLNEKSATLHNLIESLNIAEVNL